MGSNFSQIAPFAAKVNNLDRDYILRKVLDVDWVDKFYGNQIILRVYISGVSNNWFVQKFAKHQGISSAGFVGANHIAGLQFGACHVGILINGKTAIDWTDSHSVRIGEWGNSSTCFLMFEPPTGKIDFTREIGQKIADVIRKWNKKRYSLFEANCQDFVRDFFATVCNSDPFPSGLVGQRIVDLIEGKTTKSIKTQKGDVLTFSTHEQLDNIELQARKDKSLTEEEFKLLKVFHRGFQMGEHCTNKQSEHVNCPLGLLPTGPDMLSKVSISDDLPKEIIARQGEST